MRQVPIDEPGQRRRPALGRSHLRGWLTWTIMPGLLMGGCSVSSQNHPAPLPQSTVARPQSTVARPPSATGSTAPASRVIVFLIRDGRLVAVPRTPPNGVGVQRALAALQAGLSPAERSQGLHNAIPAGDKEWAVTMNAGVVLLRIPEGMDRLGTAQRVQAMGQLVFTAMAYPGVTGLQLTDGQQPVAVPTDRGELVNRPVTRDDYATIAPR